MNPTLSSPPATSPRRLTPLWFDAALLSLAAVLLHDAVFFLRFGDVHRDPWYWHVLNPFRHHFTYPAALAGLWMGRALGWYPATSLFLIITFIWLIVVMKQS